MISTKPGALSHMKQVDGLRFLAVSGVMISHFIDNQYLSYLGKIGVTLFFVLSGFLITQILIAGKDNSRNLWRFYARRFLRIFPLYYLVLFISFALNIPESRRYFPWLLTYTANFPEAMVQGNFGYLSHLWSLSIEEQFYIFFPVLVLFTPNKYLSFLFKALIVVAIASRVVLYSFVSDHDIAGWITYMWTPCCIDSFAIGALLAYYRIFANSEIINVLQRRFIFLALMVICCIVPFASVNAVGSLIVIGLFRTIFSFVCFWVIGYASFGYFTGPVGWFLNNRMVIYLGKISYGIYIYHRFLPYFFARFHFAHAWLFYIPATILISMLSWHLYELPINNLKKKFAQT